MEVMYGLNAMSYKSEGRAMEPEQITEKIIDYLSGYYWYELCDEYGNIEVDDEARRELFEDIYDDVERNPDSLITKLREDLEEIEDKNDQEYKDTEELIKLLQDHKQETMEEDLEI